VRLSAEARFFCWIAAGSAISALSAPTFLNLLDQSLGDTFGSIFPAIPFAALLGLILTLRWRELKELLASEGGPGSLLGIRIIGAGILVGLIALEPMTSQSVEGGGIALVLSFYGFSLIINPGSRRFLFPYAAICSFGVWAPFALEWAFGEPLAALSSELSAKLVGLAGFPVSWQGTQFELLSRSGDVVSGVVTPGCSSVLSVTTFLGLLVLMHIDLKKDVLSTATLAVVGVAALVFLNSVRITILMWIGYAEGANAFWGVHNWIGYAVFLGFYLTSLLAYSRMGPSNRIVYTARTRSPCSML
jgi:exosortase/archaeosortase family protein